MVWAPEEGGARGQASANRGAPPERGIIVWQEPIPGLTLSWDDNVLFQSAYQGWSPKSNDEYERGNWNTFHLINT